MALPNTITLGFSNGSINLEGKNSGPTSTEYYSIGTTMADRASLVVSQEITKAGIARCTATIRQPIVDPTTGVAKRFAKTTVSSTLSSNDPLVIRKNQLEMLGDLIAQFGNELSAGER